MSEYIERERIEKFFDGIYDCADLTFEPNDHCCSADACGHCKWYEAKNAIQKRILSIPAADVRPVVRACWLSVPYKRARIGSYCKHDEPYKFADLTIYNFCPFFFALMEDMK